MPFCFSVISSDLNGYLINNDFVDLLVFKTYYFMSLIVFDSNRYCAPINWGELDNNAKDGNWTSIENTSFYYENFQNKNFLPELFMLLHRNRELHLYETRVGIS